MKRDAKEEGSDPSCSVGQKDRPTPVRWTTVPRTMFNGRPEVSFCRQETKTFEGSKGSRIQIGWQNQDRGLDRKTNQGVSRCQNGRTTGDSPEVPTWNDGLKGNLTLPKVHGVSHLKASIQEVSQGDRNQHHTGNAVPVLGTVSTPGGCQSIPHEIV